MGLDGPEVIGAQHTHELHLLLPPATLLCCIYQVKSICFCGDKHPFCVSVVMCVSVGVYCWGKQGICHRRDKALLATHFHPDVSIFIVVPFLGARENEQHAVCL